MVKNKLKLNDGPPYGVDYQPEQEKEQEHKDWDKNAFWDNSAFMFKEFTWWLDPQGPEVFRTLFK